MSDEVSQDTVSFANALNLFTVPILYNGPYSESKIKSCFTGVSKFGPEQEGYVLRYQNTFAKYRRKSHVKTSFHWLSSFITPNSLAS